MKTITITDKQVGRLYVALDRARDYYNDQLLNCRKYGQEALAKNWQDRIDDIASIYRALDDAPREEDPGHD